MTSVIRVKRRRGEDPAEALLLSCKRLRHSQEAKEPQSQSEIESVLSFAGTISSKSEPVSVHIKEAIKQRKLHKELHPNAADFTQSKPSVISRVRNQNVEASHNNRYRVLSGKRALDLTQLDKDTEAVSPSNHESESQLLSQPKTVKRVNKESQSSADDKENSSLGSNLQPDSTEPSKRSEDCQDKVSVTENHQQLLEGSKEFCIFDIEQDIEKHDPFMGLSQQSASGISVNGKPMLCRKAEPELTDDSQFVYDLYYTHSSLADLDLQAALTVEVLCGTALVPENDEDGEEGRFVHEDSDDSNDENNWRNDYPDEDPHFFENEDYDYSEDMVDTGYLNEEDSDLLSYWMDSRCNLESHSDDEENEYEDDRSSTLDDS
ncbi:solute carrier family 7, member 6 opposite strand [Plakobranchus ocellatus]|uniref:Probable RNA polymerase II nuclear localization protein SLC7A6OS n=1 Tax=Plakobranchus ocellatus TaxID=259542 RepID=A0AAV3YCC7_9GAST|nr:solute carrier family 7, member 6 opposite strand [Plakobranchus ocellatus]